MGKERQVETCFEYFTRQLREGWRCISLSYPFALLLSPGSEVITQLLDLSDDAETLRPNAAGDNTELSKSGCAANYQCVDESITDEDATYVARDYTTTTYSVDLYNLPAHSGLGTINSVTVYARCKKTLDAGYAKIACKTHSTVYYGSEETVTTSYVTYSKQWATNPNTSNAWTWTEIDALQIGVSLKHVVSGPPAPAQGTRCTQVYALVTYSPELTMEGVITTASTVTGSIAITKVIAGAAAATSSVTGALSKLKLLTGIVGGASTVVGDLSVSKATFQGVITTTSTVTGQVELARSLKGEIPVTSSVTGTLNRTLSLLSQIDVTSTVDGALTIRQVPMRGFYYSKLGTDNLNNPPKISFSIITELNNIASFDYVIQNDAVNRAIIANNLTDDFSIMRDDGKELLRSSIDSDSIEYFAEGEGGAGKRIRLSGFANFIDLKYLLYKRMADGDAENVGSVQDEDNSTSTFTDYTTEAGDIIETKRPNAAGDNTELDKSGCSVNYQCVDEVTSDGDTSYVNRTYASSAYTLDLYNLLAHSGSGKISSVTIHAQCRRTHDNGYLKIACKTYSTVYYGSEETLGSCYTNYTKKYATNPNTGNAWTWAEIDALQIGVSLKHVTIGPPAPAQGTRCTQVYVEVEYAGAINDILPTFGGVDDALYIGKDETFFAVKMKYSTKGIQDMLKFGGSNYAGPTGAAITHNFNLSDYMAFIISTADADAAVGEIYIDSINLNSFTIHNSGQGQSEFKWIIHNNPYDKGDSTFAGLGGQTVTHTKGDTNYIPCIIPSANGSGAIGEWWITDIANTSFVIRNSGNGLTAFKWAIPRFNNGGKGASSFAGNGGVTITHNLNISGDYIPAIIPTENPNGHLGAVYVTDITTNTFTVKNTGSATTIFSWVIPDRGENTTIIIEYSKGSGVWATLDCIDESYSFTEDAGTYLLYTPNKADDWAKDTINGKNRYYIRFRITQGSYSTLPKLDRIYVSNADVCRVQFNDTPADTILSYLLEDTGYTEDATDQCPSTEITIRGEYDSKLRWIFGLGSALTWEDGNGDMQRYDCWIDTSKKVHYKQHRGIYHGDISANFRALTNKIGYGEMGTRIFSTGGQEGINQKKAIVEDLTAQGEHKLREIVLEDNKITTYEPLKKEALKSLANRKNPLKDVSGDMDTLYWLNNGVDVGDKILIHQPDWNLNNQELYVMRAVIGPSVTKLDLGNSQIHLEHLRSTLQRQIDIGNVWMHGSVSTYVAGPEEDNYERKDDDTAYPLRFTIEVPDNARGINHVEIGWELMDYKSSVGATGGGGGHSHTSGPSGGGGQHDHTVGDTYGDGGHYHTENSLGGHDHDIVIDGLHYHDILGTIAYAKTEGGVYGLANWQTSEESPGTGGGSSHTHPNPTTSGPSTTFTAVTGLNYGDSCAVSGYCVTGTNTNNAASSTHTHTQGNTGGESLHTHTVDGHRHSISYEYFTFVTDISFSSQVWTTVWDEGHSHGESTEPNHAHTITTESDHTHVNPNSNTEPVHEHTIPESSTEPVHEHNILYGVHEIAGGTTLELYVGDELVGDTYVGNQSGINITGWISKGSNSITLKPIVGDNVKGRAKILAAATVFLENLK